MGLTISLLLWYLFKNVVLDNIVVSRVYSGDDINPNDHKHLVKLVIESNNMCSGSIIGANWIVSSAHCFFEEDDKVKVLQEVFGKTNLIAQVDRVYKHPKFDFHVSLYDIAVLKTSEPIKFSDNIQPIKLARMNPKKGQSAIIAGYGMSEIGLTKPKEGMVTVISCPDELNVLCTKNIVRAGSGDSGGPLVARGRLVGVISRSCVNVEEEKNCLTVYTSVAFNFNWIMNVTRI